MPNNNTTEESGSTLPGTTTEPPTVSTTESSPTPLSSQDATSRNDEMRTSNVSNSSSTTDDSVSKPDSAGKNGSNKTYAVPITEPSSEETETNESRTNSESISYSMTEESINGSNSNGKSLPDGGEGNSSHGMNDVNKSTSKDSATNNSNDVIDLIDDDDDGDDVEVVSMSGGKKNSSETQAIEQASNLKNSEKKDDDDDVEIVSVSNGTNSEAPIQSNANAPQTAQMPVPASNLAASNIAAQQSYMQRTHDMPAWMMNLPPPMNTGYTPQPHQPQASLEHQYLVNQAISKYEYGQQMAQPYNNLMQQPHPNLPYPPFYPPPPLAQPAFPSPYQHAPVPFQPRPNEPQYFPSNPSWTPSWSNLIPPAPSLPSVPAAPTQGGIGMFRKYKLSLLSVTEFTISGVACWNIPAPSLAGMRLQIKKLASEHGKAVFEREPLNVPGHDENGDEKGRWRIPLGCYHAFYTWLSSDPLNEVEGIPESQLKIASMGKALKEKEYPSPGSLQALGVPPGLSKALAPYQRGGVDFVVGREGKALIADEMGLGKTIQAIAAMTVYEEEWPLLVLSPSGARYHWEAEFYNWLGADSPVNREDDGYMGNESQDVFYDSSDSSDFSSSGGSDSEEEYGYKNYSRLRKIKKKPKKKPVEPKYKTMNLLLKGDIYVIASSKDRIPPYTRILICPYSIATTLIESKKLNSHEFKCVIVDESHMLKNPKAKRTQVICPMLKESKRCILLSGTPAMARPMELYPQLSVLGKNGMWQDQEEFASKYCNGAAGGTNEGNNFSELHTLLTSTVMIRRMKADILKSLPKKKRERVHIQVKNERIKKELETLMGELDSSKGVLGKIYREIVKDKKNDEKEESVVKKEKEESLKNVVNTVDGKEVLTILDDSDESDDDVKKKKKANVKDENFIPDTLIEDINEGVIQDLEEKQRRKALIARLFGLTGQSKLPAIVTKLKQWIANPAKGKLVIFAHHLAVLDAIQQRAGLKNSFASKSRFIRIDGSTLPKARQKAVSAFQTNPKIRIALLGITAAGVAVTLTAASTVWFAELFWTPAILIQAEDRCHRIGQQATVKVLYFVGKNSMDEVLWPLVEKKFRDLGEFVEGKATSIVIHKDGGIEENLKGGSDESENEEEESAISLDNENGFNLKTSSKIDGADDSSSDGAMKSTSKSKPSKNNKTKNSNNHKSGSSKSMAISISDNEDEQTNESIQTSKKNNNAINFSELPGMRLYRMTFTGPSYGLILLPYQGRIIVHQRSPQRILELGKDSKPHVGDILVSINDRSLPLSIEFQAVLNLLKEAISSAPQVDLVFGEDVDFCEFFCQVVRPQVMKTKERRDKKRKRMEEESKKKESVIELLED